MEEFARRTPMCKSKTVFLDFLTLPTSDISMWGFPCYVSRILHLMKLYIYTKTMHASDTPVSLADA